VLGLVPFATPLVALAGRLGSPAAMIAGVVVVSGAVAGVRLLLTRTVEVPDPAPSDRDITGR
jgi:hypothetical protein